jgi:hypothetical protein
MALRAELFRNGVFWGGAGETDVDAESGGRAVIVPLFSVALIRG